MKESNTLLETLELNPTKTPKLTIILLHGLGADGKDFESIVPELKLPENLPIRFVFPHAPMQPVTINNGYIMRAWYDIVSFHIDEHADEAGIQRSEQELTKLINREEERGMSADKIILAGFSQGAVIALTTGLRYPKKLAGILALSGYLPYAEDVIAHSNPENKNIPIFIGHGTEDDVVPFFLGTLSAETLRKHQFNVSFHSYPIPHTVSMEEIRDIREWLISRVD
jgi:phospholipase/carboxylesterase